MHIAVILDECQIKLMCKISTEINAEGTDYYP